MDGTLTVEDASIYDFLDLVGRNIEAARRDPFDGPAAGLTSPSAGSSSTIRPPAPDRNVAHHYDLSGGAVPAVPRRRPAILLRLLPEPQRRHRPGAGAEAPTHRREAAAGTGHVGARHRLGLGRPRPLPGQADRRAGDRHHLVARTARRRAGSRQATAGLDDRVTFALRDYREQAGTFDRIVSVGMFEHVGVNHYDAFFADRPRPACRRRRRPAPHHRPDGRTGRHQRLDPQVHLSRRLLPGAFGGHGGDRAGRTVGDRHRDLAAALRRRRCASGGSASLPTAAAAASSTTSDSAGCGSSTWPPARSRSATVASAVFQIQLARRQEAVPLTRDYIAAAERRLRRGGRAPRGARRVNG